MAEQVQVTKLLIAGFIVFEAVADKLANPWARMSCKIYSIDIIDANWLTEDLLGAWGTIVAYCKCISKIYLCNGQFQGDREDQTDCTTAAGSPYIEGFVVVVIYGREKVFLMDCTYPMYIYKDTSIDAVHICAMNNESCNHN